MQRTLGIDEASFGKDHPNVARDLNNLAQLRKATNRLEEAELLMQRTLGIFAASLGISHPNTSIMSNNYRQLLLEVGCSESEAEKRIGDIKGNGDQYPRTPI